MSTALRSVGLLAVVSTTPPGPSVARLVSTPISTTSLRTLVRNAGYEPPGGNYFAGSESVNMIALAIHALRSPAEANPLGSTKTKPFIGLPVKSIGFA